MHWHQPVFEFIACMRAYRQRHPRDCTVRTTTTTTTTNTTTTRGRTPGTCTLREQAYGFFGWSVQPKGPVRWHWSRFDQLHAYARLVRHAHIQDASAPQPPQPPHSAAILAQVTQTGSRGKAFEVHGTSKSVWSGTLLFAAMTVSSLRSGESLDSQSLPVMKLVISLTEVLAPQHPWACVSKMSPSMSWSTSWVRFVRGCVADVCVCFVRQFSCLLGVETFSGFETFLRGLRRALATRPRICYQHPSFFSFARVYPLCFPELCRLLHLHPRHPEVYENHPCYRFLHRFGDRKGVLFCRNNGHVCFSAGGVLVPWPSSSREEWWRLEVLPTEVSSCITSCACAPLRQRIRERYFHCWLCEGPLPEDQVKLPSGMSSSILMDDDPNLLELLPDRIDDEWEDGHFAAGSLPVSDGWTSPEVTSR